MFTRSRGTPNKASAPGSALKLSGSAAASAYSSPYGHIAAASMRQRTQQTRHTHSSARLRPRRTGSGSHKRTSDTERNRQSDSLHQSDLNASYGGSRGSHGDGEDNASTQLADRFDSWGHASKRPRLDKVAGTGSRRGGKGRDKGKRSLPPSRALQISHTGTFDTRMSMEEYGEEADGVRNKERKESDNALSLPGIASSGDITPRAFLVQDIREFGSFASGGDGLSELPDNLLDTLAQQNMRLDSAASATLPMCDAPLCWCIVETNLFVWIQVPSAQALRLDLPSTAGKIMSANLVSLQVAHSSESTVRLSILTVSPEGSIRCWSSIEVNVNTSKVTLSSDEEEDTTLDLDLPLEDDDELNLLCCGSALSVGNPGSSDAVGRLSWGVSTACGRAFHIVLDGNTDRLFCVEIVRQGDCVEGDERGTPSFASWVMVQEQNDSQDQDIVVEPIAINILNYSRFIVMTEWSLSVWDLGIEEEVQDFPELATQTPQKPSNMSKKDVATQDPNQSWGAWALDIAKRVASPYPNNNGTNQVGEDDSMSCTIDSPSNTPGISLSYAHVGDVNLVSMIDARNEERGWCNYSGMESEPEFSTRLLASVPSRSTCTLVVLAASSIPPDSDVMKTGASRILFTLHEVNVEESITLGSASCALAYKPVCNGQNAFDVDMMAELFVGNAQQSPNAVQEVPVFVWWPKATIAEAAVLSLVSQEEAATATSLVCRQLSSAIKASRILGVGTYCSNCSLGMTVILSPASSDRGQVIILTCPPLLSADRAITSKDHSLHSPSLFCDNSFAIDGEASMVLPQPRGLSMRTQEQQSQMAATPAYAQAVNLPPSSLDLSNMTLFEKAVAEREASRVQFPKRAPTGNRQASNAKRRGEQMQKLSRAFRVYFEQIHDHVDPDSAVDAAKVYLTSMPMPALPELEECCIGVSRTILDAKPSTGQHWAENSSDSTNTISVSALSLSLHRLKDKRRQHDTFLELLDKLGIWTKLCSHGSANCLHTLQEQDEKLAAATALCEHHIETVTRQSQASNSKSSLHGSENHSQQLLVVAMRKCIFGIRGHRKSDLAAAGLTVVDVFYAQVTAISEIFVAIGEERAQEMTRNTLHSLRSAAESTDLMFLLVNAAAQSRKQLELSGKYGHVGAGDTQPMQRWTNDPSQVIMPVFEQCKSVLTALRASAGFEFGPVGYGYASNVPHVNRLLLQIVDLTKLLLTSLDSSKAAGFSISLDGEKDSIQQVASSLLPDLSLAVRREQDLNDRLHSTIVDLAERFEHIPTMVSLCELRDAIDILSAYELGHDLPINVKIAGQLNPGAASDLARAYLQEFAKKAAGVKPPPQGGVGTLRLHWYMFRRADKVAPYIFQRYVDAAPAALLGIPSVVLDTCFGDGRSLGKMLQVFLLDYPDLLWVDALRGGDHHSAENTLAQLIDANSKEAKAPTGRLNESILSSLHMLCSAVAE